MNTHIKIIYQTPAGSQWETLDEALIANKLENSPQYYPEYQLKQIVKAVCTQELEETNETN